MQWIFDNVQLLVVVGSAIAWWLMQNKQQADEEPPPFEPDGRVDPMGDPEALERTRRIQEEMRRRIAERQRGADGAPSTQTQAPARPVPPPVLPPIIRQALGIPEEQAAPPPPLPTATFDRSASDRQDRMHQQMRELEVTRREAEAKAEAIAVRTRQRFGERKARPASLTSEASSLASQDLLASLRDPRNARRAIVLREVLGPPVGLR